MDLPSGEARVPRGTVSVPPGEVRTLQEAAVACAARLELGHWQASVASRRSTARAHGCSPAARCRPGALDAASSQRIVPDDQHWYAVDCEG
jgi:hypothetical protein